MINITSTSFIVEIHDFTITLSGSISEIYGFQFNVDIKFRYLLVLSTFPNIYYSSALGVTPTSFNVNSASSKVQSYNISILSSPSAAPLTLYANTTFLYSLSKVDMNSTLGTFSSSFNLQFKFSVTGTDKFTLTISGKYPVYIYTFQIYVFIFNEYIFANNFVKLEHQFFNFTGLALGATSSVQNVYTASYTTTNSSFMFGTTGF